MPNSKSKNKKHFCAHPKFIHQYGKPVEITEKACNNCNDAHVLKTGYCCEYISCENTCNRYGNPDLCNFFRDPEDAFEMDSTEQPLVWEPDYADPEKMEHKKRKWKEKPPEIKDVKQYGRFWPAKHGAERMLTKKKPKDQNA